jgi:hypothetical protein
MSSRQQPGFDSPEPALDRAVRWAAARLGGNLRVEQAGGGERSFDESDVDELIEDARLWDRVRGDRVIEPQEFLDRVVAGLWGARLDGAGGRLEIRPTMPAGWKKMTLYRLRAHRTLLDLEVRARAEWTTVRLALSFGPPIAVLVRLPADLPVSRVVVDEVPLDSGYAIFTVQDEHEVTLYWA